MNLKGVLFMENTLVKEMPTKVKEAIIESEFDLDIRVFTSPTDDTKKGPQALGTIAGCTVSCNSCVNCTQTHCNCTVSCIACG